VFILDFNPSLHCRPLDRDRTHRFSRHLRPDPIFLKPSTYFLSSPWCAPGEGYGSGQGVGGARAPAAGASDGATPTPLQRSGRSPATVWRAEAAFCSGQRLLPQAPPSAHPLRQALLRIQCPTGGGGLPRRYGVAAQVSTTQAWPRSSRSTTSGLPVIARVLQQPFFTTEFISMLVKDCEAMMGVVS
jgi:hypothetical protein